MPAVRCDRCGRENPDHVTFCMDCGNRLKPAQRVVEPTPPRGMDAPKGLGGTAFLDKPPLAGPTPGAAPAPAPIALPIPRPQEPARPASVHPRPAAPDFEFAPKPPPSEGNGCSRCGVLNPEVNRFCLSCGATLHNSRPVIAQPVVDISSPPRAASAPVQCSRCKGNNQPGMRFCQYCGAALGTGNAQPDEAEARPVARAPDEPRLLERAPQVQPQPAAAQPVPVPQHSPPPPHSPHSPLPQPQHSPAPRSRAADSAPAGGPTLKGKLVVIAQDGSPGREYPIYDDQVDIGRQEGTIVLPNDPYVSPRHARVVLRNGKFLIRDLGSVNGIYVRLTKREPLRNADLLLVGLEVLRFETVSEAEKGLGQGAERGTHIFGSPATPRFARLLQRTVEGVTRDVYHLTREQTVIGREAGDIVFTGDPFMSRRHAGITRDPSGREFSLQDLGSSNGSYLAIRGEQQLEDGDHVRIGQHLFRLEIDRATKLI